jgi:hypothetical protein
MNLLPVPSARHQSVSVILQQPVAGLASVETIAQEHSQMIPRDRLPEYSPKRPRKFQSPKVVELEQNNLGEAIGLLLDKLPLLMGGFDDRPPIT